MQLFLPDILLISIKPAPVYCFGAKLIVDPIPVFGPLFQIMIWIFINPMLKFIDGSDPRENGDYSFQLLNLCTLKIFRVFKINLPVFHTEKFHGHTGNFCNFHRIFLKCAQLKMMGKKRVYSMSTFMYHRSHVMHLSGCIHEYKRGAGFCQRTIISTRSFANPALKIKAIHFFHCQQTVCKEWSELSETLYCFLQKFITGFKWVQWLLVSWFGVYIPGS